MGSNVELARTATGMHRLSQRRGMTRATMKFGGRPGIGTLPVVSKVSRAPPAWSGRGAAASRARAQRPRTANVLLISSPPCGRAPALQVTEDLALELGERGDDRASLHHAAALGELHAAQVAGDGLVP